MRHPRGAPFSRAETRAYRVQRSRILGMHDRWLQVSLWPYLFRNGQLRALETIMPYAPRMNLLEQAAARRDSYAHILATLGERCEDCDESVKGLAVFECSGPACSTGMFCCPGCASVVDHDGELWLTPRWTSVVLVRDGCGSSAVARAYQLQADRTPAAARAQ